MCPALGVAARLDIRADERRHAPQRRAADWREPRPRRSSRRPTSTSASSASCSNAPSTTRSTRSRCTSKASTFPASASATSSMSRRTTTASMRSMLTIPPRQLRSGVSTTRTRRPASFPCRAPTSGRPAGRTWTSPATSASPERRRSICRRKRCTSSRGRKRTARSCSAFTRSIFVTAASGPAAPV